MALESSIMTPMGLLLECKEEHLLLNKHDDKHEIAEKNNGIILDVEHAEENVHCLLSDEVYLFYVLAAIWQNALYKTKCCIFRQQWLVAMLPAEDILARGICES